MNMEETQRRLQGAYADWKRSLHFDGDVAAQLSPPLLISVPSTYINAKNRILFFGQETFGWKWTRDLRVQYPDYPADYSFNNIFTMHDFLTNDDAVEALCWGCCEFNFAKYQPENWSSPFWKGFVEVQAWPNTGIIWNNLSRCDYQGGSVLNAPEVLRTRLLECQSELVAKELEILQPHVCLFFTGPDYDDLLSEVFPKCERTEAVEGISVRELARIRHPCLPAGSFRTYHPRYLRQSGRWDFLSQLRRLSGGSR
jgi:hypothetical protein